MRIPARAWPKPIQGRSIAVPAASLLHLGAAIRLLRWERNGLSIHLDAGLPSAREALSTGLRSFDIGMKCLRSELAERVFALTCERLAWDAMQDFRGAEIVLDDFDDETCLRALAEYLWMNRRSSALEEVG